MLVHRTKKLLVHFREGFIFTKLHMKIKSSRNTDIGKSVAIF